MADTDDMNAKADRSRTDDVLSAVPTPNRATRRKMEARGEAVAVPPVATSMADVPPVPEAEKLPAAAIAEQPVVAAQRAATSHALSAGPVEAEGSSPKRAAPVRKATVPAAKPATGERSGPKTSTAKPQPAKPSVSAMQASAPASLRREPALADQGTTPAPTTKHPAVQAGVPAFSIKDMTMDMSTNFSGFQTAMTEAQAKAKAAFEKSSNVMGEVGEFTKGNVEALVESGKILAGGVQEIGSTIAAESRSAFEAMTGDIKELAAAKSPTDFLKIQSDMLRKNFDSAVAYSSKNSEAFLKLMSDAAAPLSGRVSLAVEKARQTTTQTMAAPVTV